MKAYCVKISYKNGSEWPVEEFGLPVLTLYIDEDGNAQQITFIKFLAEESIVDASMEFPDCNYTLVEFEF